MAGLWIAVIILLVVNICLTLKIRRIERRLTWSPEGGDPQEALQRALEAQRQEDRERLTEMERLQVTEMERLQGQMVSSIQRTVRSVIDLNRQQYG